MNLNKFRPHPRSPNRKPRKPLNRRQIVKRLVAVAIVVGGTAILFGAAHAHGLHHHHHVKGVLDAAASVLGAFATATVAAFTGIF